MIKISAPFRGINEVLSLIESGADELYCGYLSPEWDKKYSYLEFERKGPGSNFTDIDELKEAIGVAHSKNVPVYLALNGLYVNEQYPLLLKIFRKLYRLGFDAFIVADIGLILTLRNMEVSVPIHLSTGGTVFNSEAVDFYRKLGIFRIVLDRQMRLEWIKDISENNPNIEFEVFILNTLCVNIDGFCTYTHIYKKEKEDMILSKKHPQGRSVDVLSTYDIHGEGDACCLKYKVDVLSGRRNKNVPDAVISPVFYKQIRDGVECGACALYDIARTKVRSVKIIGRQLSTQERLASVKFIREALSVLNGGGEEIRRVDFLNAVQMMYRRVYGYKGRCRGNNCYHPEVLSVV